MKKLLVVLVVLATLTTSCRSACQRRKDGYFKRYVNVEQVQTSKTEAV